MNFIIDQALCMDGISQEDRKAVGEYWKDCSDLKVGGRMSIESFHIGRPNLCSVIQKGQLVFEGISVSQADINNIELDKPFLALFDEDDFVIYYVSY